MFVPGLIDRGQVLAARERVLRSFSELEGVLDSQHAISEGVLEARCGVGCVPFLEGQNELTHSEEVLKGVLESASMFEFFGHLYGEPARTFDFKWLRGVPRDAFTGAHMDWVYMGRGTRDLLTSWIPFGSNPLEMGGLAILEASNRLPGFEKLRRTYGEIDVERIGLDGTGWFTLDPAELARFDSGARWVSADFEPGDVLIFKPHTLHMSTTNVTARVRISCDVRWQPAAKPADPRYIGTIDISKFSKFGHHSKDEKEPPAAEEESRDSGVSKVEAEAGRDAEPSAKRQKTKVTMADLKREWGLVPPPELEW